MQKKACARLIRIEQQETLSSDQEAEFLLHLQRALLLAMKEKNYLTEMGYQRAYDRLIKESGQ